MAKLSTVKALPDTVMQSETEKPENESTAESSFLTGWRLQVLNFSLCLGLFLSTLDSSIVSTSIVSITAELQEFSRSSWIVSAYLLTYTSFLIPLAKASDIYGRRALLALATTILIAFSAGSGWSTSMVQLCVFRAFQGIGGGGVFGLTFVILPEMVRPQQYALYSAILSSTFAFSSLLGPLVGGIINHSDPRNWRWIFWLNLPVGAVTLVLSWLALPTGFPYHRMVDGQQRPEKTFKRFDVLGAALILAGGVLFVAGLETGGTQFNWSSAAPIALICTGILCWLLLLAWEWIQPRRNTQQEPVLPWRVLSNRIAVGNLLYTACVGAALFSCIIQLPQRFQVVDKASPLLAGCRLLALTLGSPVGSGLAGVLTQKAKLPHVYILALGSLVQVLGLGLYTGLDAGVTTGTTRDQYVFMVIAGIGFGISTSVAVMIAPLIFEARDMAVGMGAISQFRALGGSIGVSASASVLNHRLRSDLGGLLTSQQLKELQQSAAELSRLSPATAQAFRDSYARGTQQIMYLVTAMTAFSLIVIVLMFEKRPRRMS